MQVLGSCRRWESIRSKGNIIGSLHGHVHRFSYQKERYDENVNVDVYTVDQVEGSNYGVVTFQDYKITSIKNCSSICEEIK